jgi:hypothetical protein
MAPRLSATQRVVDAVPNAVPVCTVIGVEHGLAPWRLAGAWHVVASLELPAGRAAEVGVEEGDVLVFEDVVDLAND